jgi:RNA polymerase sigma-70 factor (ECF subfamily)
LDNSDLDDNLILKIADGDRDAFRTVYLVTKNVVYGFALSILRCPEDAEDVMHDAYLKIYDGAKSYVPKGKPLSWIMTIVRNLAYNKVRAVRETEDLGDHVNDLRTDDMDAENDRMELIEAMGVLEKQDREIVVLHAVGGMKHREIADILNMPVSTVLSRYNRALEKMRKEISKEGGACG